MPQTVGPERDTTRQARGEETEQGIGPIGMGGSVPLFGGGFNAAVCDHL